MRILIFTILTIMSTFFGCASKKNQIAERIKDVEHKRNIAQLDLHYEIHGKGPPILLLHGFGASMYAWRHFIEALSEYYKLILIDLKGFGLSPKPLDSNYSIFDQTSLIYRFILKHDLRDLTIIGHSFGGGVSLLTALKLEEHAPNRLSSLILIDSASYVQPLPSYIGILRLPIIGRLALSVLPNKYIVKLILELAYYDDDKIPKEAIDAYAKYLNQPGSYHALINTAKQIVPQKANEIIILYRKIKVPTLIIWGRHDQIIPLELGKRLHQDIPHSKLVIIEESGHNPHEETAKETLRIILQFLLENTKTK